MNPVIFKKILIANRGEIAVRVIRSARKMGIQTVAVFSDSDREALHVRLADEAKHLGSDQLSDSYLNIGKIIAAAKESGAQAIHPGYGFLSENPEFAHSCQASGIVFIGPGEEAIRLMGNKIASREIAKKTGVPVIEGLTGTPSEILSKAGELGFPLLVKAAAGGGGKGMRVVRHIDDLREALTNTSREASNYFGDGSVFVERFLENPRHIEIQVLGDSHGNLIHLFERECSIQRRHQKIVEEAPSPTLDPIAREKMVQAALRLASRIGYKSAGTLEFLVDSQLGFYFLEMNTRIQVEHPVTEMITGIDLVEEQIRIASGFPLRLKQEDLTIRGHAIECRIYAEDPSRDFLPSPGVMGYFHLPAGPDVRNDSGFDRPSEVFSFFDPMISKMVVWGEHRNQAIERMTAALKGTAIHGPSTNVEYLVQLIQDEDFIRNHISTSYCETQSARLLECHQEEKAEMDQAGPLAAFLALELFGEKENHEDIWKRIGYWRLKPQIPVLLDGGPFELSFRLLPDKEILFEYEGNENRMSILRIDGGMIHFQLNGRQVKAFVSRISPTLRQITLDGIHFHLKRQDILEPPGFFRVDSIHQSGGRVVSPMPGRVVKVLVSEGDLVLRDAVLLVVEAMKMENNILSPVEGVVTAIHAEPGEMVDPSRELISIKAFSEA